MAQSGTGAAFPAAWGTTVGLTSIQVLPYNPGRTGLIFTNQSPGTAIAIVPGQLNLGAFGVYAGFANAVAVINGPGCITMSPGDKFIIDNINCTAAWFAIAGSSSAALTILES